MDKYTEIAKSMKEEQERKAARFTAWPYEGGNYEAEYEPKDDSLILAEGISIRRERLYFGKDQNYANVEVYVISFLMRCGNPYTRIVERRISLEKALMTVASYMTSSTQF